MIKNDRQHQITRSRVERLRHAQQELLNRLRQDPVDRGRTELELRAVRAEIRRMQAEIEDYEALKLGRAEVGLAETVDDLPRLLIRARIAAGLTQAGLAARLGLKEQQIQRYEATDYESASLSRLRDVATQLGLKLGGSLHALDSGVSAASLLRRCEKAGLARDFVQNRFGPIERDAAPHDLVSAVARLAHVYGWSPNDILTGEMQPALASVAPAGYKMPKKAGRARAAGLTVYAHFLVELVLRATPASEQRLPSDSAELLERIAKSRPGRLSFSGALETVWELGVPVLPLAEGGGFHAAYWRRGGRGVIVLNPMRDVESLWLFNLFHECGHAAEKPEEDERLLLEDAPGHEGEVSATLERRANAYATETILGGRTQQLFEQVMEKTRGRMDLVQRGVRYVARHEGVDVGALAFNVAHQLSKRGHDWWGAAVNLQEGEGSPLQTARDALVERIQWSILDPLDADLLARALDAPTGRSGSPRGERDAGYFE